MTTVKIKRPAKPPEDETIVVDYSQPQNGVWSAAKLYSRSQDHRRILFLELMAWAITEAEGHTTREDWDAFASGLAETRNHVWGERPWPNAKDNDAFLAHVRHIANTFANSQPSTGVNYERRRTDPLAAS